MRYAWAMSWGRRAFVVGIALLAACAGATPAPKLKDSAHAAEGDAASEAWVDGCPPEMARLGGFCVDRYEASVVTMESGVERPWSPYATVGGARVRAKSVPNVVPQAYISQVEAAAACAAADKRLCSARELARACRGEDPRALYPYGGAKRMHAKCNEGKGSSVQRLFGKDPSRWSYENFLA